MRSINFNIGSNKKINYVRIIFIGLSVLFASTFLIKAGIDNILFLNSKTSEKQSLIDDLNKYIDSISINEQNIKKGIKTNKSKWEPRIKFINYLIKKKTFPYLKRLDILEELMPNDAYLKSIIIKYGVTSRILLTVETNSFTSLQEVYRKFEKLNVTFGSETVKDRKYLNNISLVIKDD